MAPIRIPGMKSPIFGSSLHNLLSGACSLLLVSSTTEAFTALTLSRPKSSTAPLSSSTRYMIYAPPGSGYARPEDEESPFPDTYLPMMEYPGTMRPGRTPENMPFQDLPIGDDDPDPVPWPHFQQIEWHHKWDPPHPNPIPMEDFIEMNGRWATPEMEAKMRVGARRGVREKQEQEARDRYSFVITDDDEDDSRDEPMSLGESMFGELGSAADEAITADAVRPRAAGEKDFDEDEGRDAGADDDDLDNFLLDLGLDADMDVDAMGDDDSPAPSTRKKSKKLAEDDMPASTLDMLSEGGDIADTITVDDDYDLDLGLDDDMGDDGLSTVPLEDFGDEDPLEGDDLFDEGGFDFDGDFDDGDVW